MPKKLSFLLVSVLLGGAVAAPAWDYEGHRIVNQLALASLPADFPAFVRDPANAERIAFLSGEPDRWRNVPDLPIKQSGGSWTDHFLDVEQVPDAGLDLSTLTSFRYDFIVQFAAGRAAHPDKFRPVDPARDLDHTFEWPGFAPWAITEYFERLRSAFTYLKTYEELGTPEEIANARANVIVQMGVMGHYVGDCAQPLHTTVHHNGWVGPNPNGYSNWKNLHVWIDGGFIGKAHITTAGLSARARAPHLIPLAARPDARDPMFVAVLDYLLAQHAQVEPLYQLEKDGKFSDALEHEGKYDQDPNPANAEGRAFIENQLLNGGEMLASIWLTAWKQTVPDTFLRSVLVRRAAASGSHGGK